MSFPPLSYCRKGEILGKRANRVLGRNPCFNSNRNPHQYPYEIVAILRFGLGGTHLPHARKRVYCILQGLYHFRPADRPTTDPDDQRLTTAV
jgi:hypothetical protein